MSSRWRLIAELVAPEDLVEDTYALAAEMAELAPLTLSRTKRIRDAVLANPALDDLTAEQEHIPFANFDSEDFHEGRAAFVERRKPRFPGR